MLLYMMSSQLSFLKYYTKELAKGVIKNKTLVNFDGLLYLFGIPIMLVTFLVLALNTILYFGTDMTLDALFYNYAKYLISTFLAPVASAVLIMFLERKPIKPMIKGLICYPLFLGSWIAINIKCLIKPDTKWEKIEHGRDIKIGEII